jgi:hypothetical protein
MNDPKDSPSEKKDLPKLWEIAREHKFFSGIGGAILIVAATFIVASHGQDATTQTTAGGSGSGVITDPPSEPTTSEAPSDEDGDGVLDTVDECPGESGIGPSGCPDSDGDWVIDKLDRCPSVAAPTEDGCPVTPQATSLSALIDQGREIEGSENANEEQITVGGITDPSGVRMSVGEGYRSATFNIPTNREFQTIRGRVGIASEPCSAGSVGYVAIRDAEGQALWPRNGQLQPVHRDAMPFKIRIASEDAVVLYAEAPEAEEGYCGSYARGTEVGWMHTRLISTE